MHIKSDELQIPSTDVTLESITISNNIEPKWITMDGSQAISSSNMITTPDVWGGIDNAPKVWATRKEWLNSVYKDIETAHKARLHRKPAPDRCPYCNVRYLPEDRFCVGCGAPV